MTSNSPMPLVHFDLHASGLPPRLRGLDSKLGAVDVVGDFEAGRAVAIVGSRHPTEESLAYAAKLAGELARRDVVVVSGGAIGIDLAAHQGALRAKGRTWCVLASTYPVLTPSSHEAILRDIPASGGALFWTGGGGALMPAHFLQRNKLLVGLCDAVVVVQAKEISGSRAAAKSARRLGRPLWVVAPSPWFNRAEYRGNVLELRAGARPLVDEDELFESLGVPGELAAPVSSPVASPASSRLEPGRRQVPAELAELDAIRTDPVELAILRVLRDASPAVLHVDEIVSKSSLPYPAAASALLTLCLEAVVVEGPGGFYRRRLATPAGSTSRHRDGREAPRSGSR